MASEIIAPSQRVSKSQVTTLGQKATPRWTSVQSLCIQKSRKAPWIQMWWRRRSQGWYLIGQVGPNRSCLNADTPYSQNMEKLTGGLAPPGVPYSEIARAMETPVDWRHLRPTSSKCTKWVYFPLVKMIRNEKVKMFHWIGLGNIVQLFLLASASAGWARAVGVILFSLLKKFLVASWFYPLHCTMGEPAQN